FGPDFRDYAGNVPPLQALFQAIFTDKPLAVFGDYFHRRERELAEIPVRYPRSLFAPDALNDAYALSQAGSFLQVLAAREQPGRALAAADRAGDWRLSGVMDTARSAELARQLADGYPDSRQAPAALLRLGEAEAQHADPARSRTVYTRIIREYPRS